MQAVVIASLFVFGGLLTYTVSERRHRRRWWVFEQHAEAAQGLPHRRGELPHWRTRQVRGRAPGLIRRTALWSIYMGQMAVPGGLMGLMGLFVAGIGLVSIPGMILAIRIWRLGYALLRREPGAVVEARRLGDFAVWLNVLTMLVGLVGFMFGAWGLALVLWPYAAVSLAHAGAMGRCADLLERELADEQAARESAQRESAYEGGLYVAA